MALTVIFFVFPGLKEVMTMEAKDRKTLLKAQQGELDAVLMYRALADTVKSEADAEVFRRLAA